MTNLMVAMFYHYKGKRIYFVDGEKNDWIFVYHQQNDIVNAMVWESKKNPKAGGFVGSIAQKSDGFCHGVFDLSHELHLTNMFLVFKKDFFPGFYEIEKKIGKNMLGVKFQEGKIILKDGLNEKILGKFEPNIKGIENLTEKAIWEIKKYCSLLR